MTVRILILLVCVLFLTTLSTAKNERKREYQQGKQQSQQNMTVVNNAEYENDNEEIEEDEDDEEVEITCRWKWSKWKPCSKSCDSGNTSRVGMCVCDGFDMPFADSQCTDVPNPLDTEVVSCNEHPCGEKAACNKRCWMEILEKNQHNNLTDGIYQCSLGCTTDDTCPKGKTYAQVLTEPVPSMAENAEWYYLAKEWYAAILNQEAGVSLSPLAVEAINNAMILLENCAGWSPEEMQLLAMVYVVKEKLNRANNEIGGLDTVDEQVAMMLGGETGTGTDTSESSSQKSLLGVYISIPMAAVAIIAVAIMVAIYYVRRKSYMVVEANEVVVPESSLDNGNEEVPLQDQPKEDDSSSEKLG